MVQNPSASYCQSINDGTAGSAALAVLRLIAQQERLEFSTLPVPVQGEKEGAGGARTNMKKVSRERRIDYSVRSAEPNVRPLWVSNTWGETRVRQV